MAGKWKYYNEQAYNTKKREQKDRKCPPRANFLAAVSYIKTLLDSKKTNWAAFGGLELLGLGSNRDMHDLHVVFDGGAFEKIRVYLEKDSRTRIPQDMNSLFAAKVLVGTGPSHKDRGCMEDADIEVNLVPSGSNGTPPNDILRQHQISLQVPTGNSTLTFKGLDMLYLIRTTIRNCTSLDLSWDPRKDLVFLCERYPNEVVSIRDQLVKEDLYECLFWRSFFSVVLPPELQRQCSQTLLGLDQPLPDPKKSVTPKENMELSTSQPTPPLHAKPIGLTVPGHATEGSARPPLKSHKSSPMLSGTPNHQARLHHAQTAPLPFQNNSAIIPNHTQAQKLPASQIQQGPINQAQPYIAKRYSHIPPQANDRPVHSRHASQDSLSRPNPSNALLPLPGSDVQARLRRPASFHSGLNELHQTTYSGQPQGAPALPISGGHVGSPPSSGSPSKDSPMIHGQSPPQQPQPKTGAKSEYIAFAPKDRRTTLPAPVSSRPYEATPPGSGANSPRSKPQQAQAQPRASRMSVPALTDLPPSLLPGGGMHRRSTSQNRLSALVGQSTEVFELPATTTPKPPEPAVETSQSEIANSKQATSDLQKGADVVPVPAQRRYTAYQPSAQPYQSPNLSFETGSSPPREPEPDHLFLADSVTGLKLSDVKELTADPSNEEEEEEDYT